jgi:radical SAM superfamily enzyme YgiQ (UPF0313 family)
MKISLVTASTFERSSRIDPDELLDEDPPLGVLSLAGALRVHHHTPAVFDLTQFLREWNEPDDDCAAAAEWITATDADVYGFSTICSSYPFTLRVAREVRRLAPGAAIILGGPQATVTDREVIEAFPCIDVVVRGEGERVLPDLARALAAGTDLQDVAGLTYRKGGAAHRSADAPIIADLDTLAEPAYDLDPLMPRRMFASVELGRGCPFACEFCSTNDFFRRKFRLRSPTHVIAEMRRIQARYGHSRFGLVHDMFTVDRKRVLAFCDAMLEFGAGMQWSCSARTDCVDEALLERLGEAGCVGLFFGVESGAPTLQKRMGKHLDLEEARRVIAAASRCGVSTTVSTIIGFPDETPEELGQTATFLMDVIRDDRADPQVHLLAALAGTPLAHRYKHALRLHEQVRPDASGATTELHDVSPDDELIEAFPDLFPNFYLVPTLVPTEYLHEVRQFLYQGIRRFRWLLVALDLECGGILAVFDAWLAWRPRAIALGDYYRQRLFVLEFLQFVSDTYVGRGCPATDVLTAYSQALCDLPARADASDSMLESTEYLEDGVPVLPPLARFLKTNGSVPATIDALKRRQSPLARDLAPEVPLFVQRTPPRFYRLVELPPIPAAILGWCDGTRRVPEVIDAFRASGLRLDGVDAPDVCRYMLAYLANEGLLRFRPDTTAAYAATRSPHVERERLEPVPHY